jgi:hypothetical protein
MEVLGSDFVNGKEDKFSLIKLCPSQYGSIRWSFARRLVVVLWPQEIKKYRFNFKT